MANEVKGGVNITTGVGITDLNANGILDLASGEVTQLANIGGATISSGQWAYLGEMDQGVATSDSPTFESGTFESDSNAFILFTRAVNNSGGPTMTGNKARGTLASPVIVQDGDRLFDFVASGYDGSSYQAGAFASFGVDGTPGVGNLPTKFTLQLNDGSSLKDVVEIGSNGDAIIHHDLTIGEGAIGADYNLVFDGETNDGTITWREDEANFGFDSPVSLGETLTGFQVLFRVWRDGVEVGRIDNDGSDIRLRATNGADVKIGDDEGTKIIIKDGGNVGFDELNPRTILEITSDEPYFTLHNESEEDTDGGRESYWEARGEQSGGEESALGRIEFSHDGASDDEKGKIVFSTNDGADGDTPTKAMEISSDQKISLTTGTGINEFSIDGTLGGNSDDAAPTEKAVKTYVDNIVIQGTFAEIYVAQAFTTQVIPTGITYQKIIAFTTNGESSNCTADVANDKITITQTGRYFVSGSFSSETNTVAEVRGSAFLGGVQQTKIHFSQDFAAASNNSQSMSFSGIIDVTSTPIDLDFRVRHNDAGSVNYITKDADLSVHYLGET